MQHNTTDVNNSLFHPSCTFSSVNLVLQLAKMLFLCLAISVVELGESCSRSRFGNDIFFINCTTLPINAEHKFIQCGVDGFGGRLKLIRQSDPISVKAIARAEFKLK